MRIILVVLVAVLLFSCIFVQQSPTIIIPNMPRVVVDKDGGAREVEDNIDGLTFRPDLTRGYIENQAAPYLPRVWLLKGDKKILLVGETEEGEPKVLDWQIFKFNLPEGVNQVIIERWREISGTWQRVGAPEFLPFEVAKTRRGYGGYFYGSGWFRDNNFDWRIVIRQNRSFVSTGGRGSWWGHGRWGW